MRTAAASAAALPDIALRFFEQGSRSGWWKRFFASTFVWRFDDPPPFGPIELSERLLFDYVPGKLPRLHMRVSKILTFDNGTTARSTVREFDAIIAHAMKDNCARRLRPPLSSRWPLP